MQAQEAERYIENTQVTTETIDHHLQLRQAKALERIAVALEGLAASTADAYKAMRPQTEPGPAPKPYQGQIAEEQRKWAEKRAQDATAVPAPGAEGRPFSPDGRPVFATPPSGGAEHLPKVRTVDRDGNTL